MKTRNNIQFLIILATILFFTSCIQKHHQQEIKIPPKWVAVDTNDKDIDIALLPNTDGQKQIALTNEEIILIDSLTKEAINIYNLGREAYFKKRKIEQPLSDAKLSDYTIDLKHYKRQYLVSLNKKGQKEVYINCFCSIPDSEDWKTEEVIVRDGGKCYFQLKVNLSEKSYFEFGINGLG